MSTNPEIPATEAVEVPQKSENVLLEEDINRKLSAEEFPLKQTIEELRKEFQKYPDNEVELKQFVDIMTKTKQLKDESEAIEMFHLLDLDKNGNISFSEFVAPFVPVMNKEQVIEMTEEDHYTVQDLTKLRSIFDEMRKKAKFVRVKNLRVMCELLKLPTIKRALSGLTDILNNGLDPEAIISPEDFAESIAQLESRILKKYCLYNYIDRFKQKIDDFPVECDPKIDKKNKSSSLFTQKEELKQKVEIKEPDPALTKKKPLPTQGVSEFVGRVQSLRDVDDVSIKNPEYILTILIEDALSKINEMKDGKRELDLNRLIESAMRIFKSCTSVCQKLKDMKQRVAAYRARLDTKDEFSSNLAEVNDGHDSYVIDQATCFASVNAMITDASKKMSTPDKKNKGYLITYQQFQSIQYMAVNFHILATEFNDLKTKNNDYIQYKTNYEEQQKKWWKKVEASAGDVIDEMKSLRKENEEQKKLLAFLTEENLRLKKMNMTMENFLGTDNMQFDFSQMKMLIERSEKELIDLGKFNDKNYELLNKLRNTTGYKDVSVNAAVDFFESKSKKKNNAMINIQEKAISDQIEKEEAERKKISESALSLILQKKKLNHEQNREEVYQVPDILDYVFAQSELDRKNAQLTKFYLDRLEPFCENPKQNCIYSIVNDKMSQTHLIFDKDTKVPVNLFLVLGHNMNYQLLVLSQQMMQIEVFDCKDLEAFVSHEENPDIFAFKIFNKPGLIMESRFRSEILLQLISVFEKHIPDKFKVYISKSISIKHKYDPSNTRTGAFEDNLSPEELDAKMKELKARLKQNMSGGLTGIIEANRAKSEALPAAIPPPAAKPAPKPAEIPPAQKGRAVSTAQLAPVNHYKKPIREEQPSNYEFTVKDMFQHFHNLKTKKTLDGQQKTLLQMELSFNVLQQQLLKIDPKFVKKVMDNPMACVHKTGLVFKKSEGIYAVWEERFLVLTNCGFLYFKQGVDQPKKFKPLNNFILESLTPEEEEKVGKPNCFKVRFSKSIAHKDNLISCLTASDKRDWIRALQQYQLDLMEVRMEAFAQRLTMDQ